MKEKNEVDRPRPQGYAWKVLDSPSEGEMRRTRHTPARSHGFVFSFFDKRQQQFRDGESNSRRDGQINKTKLERHHRRDEAEATIHREYISKSKNKTLSPFHQQVQLQRHALATFDEIRVTELNKIKEREKRNDQGKSKKIQLLSTWRLTPSFGAYPAIVGHSNHFEEKTK